MFWLVYDAQHWSPDKGEVAALLGKDVTFRLLDSFEKNSDHPLFALLHSVEGLHAFNAGVIEVESGKAEDLPSPVLENADGRFSDIFGPFSDKDVRECLLRLHHYTLAESTVGDVLSMISLLQGVRQRLSAEGRLEKWRGPIETMSETLSGIAEDLQFNPARTFQHLVEPLHPVTTRGR